MFTYIKCLVVFKWVELVKFSKIKIQLLEKDDYTDCKFICGIADEGIMKSDRSK